MPVNASTFSTIRLACIAVVFLFAFVGCNTDKHKEILAYRKLKTIGIALRDYDELIGRVPNLNGNKSEFEAIPLGEASWRASLLNRLIAIPKSSSEKELKSIVTSLFTIENRLLISAGFEANGESLRRIDSFKVVLFTVSLPDAEAADLLTRGDPWYRKKLEKSNGSTTFVLFANGNVAIVPNECLIELLQGTLQNDRQSLENKGVRFVGPELNDFRH